MVSHGRVISFGLLVLALGLALATQSAGQQQSPVPGQQAQRQSVDDQSGKDKARHAPSPPPVGASQRPDSAKAAAKAKPNYDEANLEVQRRIADYTAQSVKMTDQALKFTGWAVFLTTIESLLFIVTTVFTVFAVLEARRAANISAAALELARQSAQSERPYLYLDRIEESYASPPKRGDALRDATVRPANQDVFGSFRFVIKNVGTKPARRVWMNVMSLDQNRDFPEFTHPRPPAWRIPDIPANGEVSTSTGGKISSYFNRAGGRHFQILHISYVDVFDIRHNDIFYFTPTNGLDPFWRQVLGVNEDGDKEPAGYDTDAHGKIVAPPRPLKPA